MCIYDKLCASLVGKDDALNEIMRMVVFGLVGILCYCVVYGGTNTR